MSDERIILIKGDSSKWYEQAIFIIKKNIPGNKVPVDLVFEAEKIINGYMQKQTPSFEKKFAIEKKPELVVSKKTLKRKNKTFDAVLNTIILIGLIALFGLLMWYYF